MRTISPRSPEVEIRRLTSLDKRSEPHASESEESGNWDSCFRDDDLMG